MKMRSTHDPAVIPTRPARHRLSLTVACACVLAGCAPLPSAPACPDASAQTPSNQRLYGRWLARIDGQPEPAQVLLHRHPDYDGVRGTVSRPGQAPAQLAGDINPADGQLALDESQDGKRISASWTGALVAGSCGKRFSGNWHSDADDKDHAFTLERVQGEP